MSNSELFAQDGCCSASRWIREAEDDESLWLKRRIELNSLCLADCGRLIDDGDERLLKISLFKVLLKV